MENNQIATFWELIENHSIEIPIIQRDYAQGRSNPQSTEVRNTFISQIKEVLTQDEDSSNTVLHLNFIYGKINGKKDAAKLEENKEAVKNMLSAVKVYSKNLNLNIDWNFSEADTARDRPVDTTFIPLDGQQRLTTLFLLHLYFKPDNNEDVENKLKKFTYKIRPSSRDFCEKLTDNISFSLDASKTKTTISEHIANSPWFFKYWIKDPSVRGMLRMLDEIHLQFHGIDRSACWNKLKQIQFDFLDLDKLKLTDELYVKMNARGVPLTPFENFKAWLIEYIQKENIEIKSLNESKSWTELIDTTWTDLFWSNKDSDNMLIDEELMRYFRNMMQIFLILQEDFNPETDSKEEERRKAAQDARDKAALLATTKDDKSGEYLYIPNSFYESNELLTEKNLNEIFYSIDNLVRYESLIKDAFDGEDFVISFFDKRGSVFKKFIDNKTTYADKVVFYALHIFLKNITESESDFSLEHALRNWMRVVRNLVVNSNIDSIPLFKRAISSINWIQERSIKIYEFLNEKDEQFTLRGFEGNQTKEEIIKAKLILDKDPDWEKLIFHAENHKLFRGCIRFLINDYQPFSLNTDGAKVEIFEKRLEIASKIFIENGLSEELKKDAIFLRAFVSRFSVWNELWHLNYDAKATTWKNILKNEIYMETLGKMLDVESINVYHQYIQEDSVFREREREVHETLYKTNLLSKIWEGCSLHYWNPIYILYPHNAKAEWKKYVVDNHRNELLSKLVNKGNITIPKNQHISMGNEQYIFWGKDIPFMYNERQFVFKWDNKIVYDEKVYSIEDDEINEEKFVEKLDLILNNEFCCN